MTNFDQFPSDAGDLQYEMHKMMLAMRSAKESNLTRLEKMHETFAELRKQDDSVEKCFMIAYF